MEIGRRNYIYSSSMPGLKKSPNSSSLEGISYFKGRDTQVVFMPMFQGNVFRYNVATPGTSLWKKWEGIPFQADRSCPGCWADGP